MVAQDIGIYFYKKYSKVVCVYILIICNDFSPFYWNEMLFTVTFHLFFTFLLLTPNSCPIFWCNFTLFYRGVILPCFYWGDAKVLMSTHGALLDKCRPVTRGGKASLSVLPAKYICISLFVNAYFCFLHTCLCIHIFQYTYLFTHLSIHIFQ